MNPIRVTFNAALNNPNDPSEVTLVADAVGVGKTHRLATGQIITWTAALLRSKVHTFIGMPVNIDLDEEGEATGHSRRAVGAVTHAFFDERKQVITVQAALWPHYFPSTTSRIKELAAEHRIQVSMEFIPEGEMLANEDGSETPVDGEFSGLGIVRVGADPRNKVILVAALAEDEAKDTMDDSLLDKIVAKVGARFALKQPNTPEQDRDERNAELAAAHEGSLEWTSRRLAEHLAAKRGNDYDAPYCYVIATYPKYAIYQEGESYFQINFSRKGRDMTFDEPVEVDPTYSPVEASASQDDADPAQMEVAALGTELSEEQKASLRSELLAELKPQLDELEAVKAENATLKAEKADAEKAAAANELAASRLTELDTILPADGDETKAQRDALVRALDDAGFAALKATLAAAADAKGGISTDAEAHAGTEEEATTVSAEDRARMVKEALAAAGYAAPAKDQ